MDPQSPASRGDVPPIVLFVDDDQDTLEMYSTYFEMSGFWVAKRRTADEAVSSLLELRPDLVVTDAEFSGRPDGERLVEVVKADPATAGVPVIVLSGHSELAPATVAKADLCLVKPILPDALLLDAQRLIALSHTLRDRCQRARGQSAELAVCDATSARPEPRAVDAARRPCPQCGGALEWLERGHIGDAEYDYYRWCTHGCGLYCYDRGASRWVKLV